MNKILRYWISIFIGALIIGCTTLSEKVKHTRQEIIGKNIDVVFSSDGVPTFKAPLPSAKGTVYVWDNGGCKNNYTTDDKGIITDFSVSGNCAPFQK